MNKTLAKWLTIRLKSDYQKIATDLINFKVNPENYTEEFDKELNKSFLLFGRPFNMPKIMKERQPDLYNKELLNYVESYVNKKRDETYIELVGNLSSVLHDVLLINSPEAKELSDEMTKMITKFL